MCLNTNTKRALNIWDLVLVVQFCVTKPHFFFYGNVNKTALLPCINILFILILYEYSFCFVCLDKKPCIKIVFRILNEPNGTNLPNRPS